MVLLRAEVPHSRTPVVVVVTCGNAFRGQSGYPKHLLSKSFGPQSQLALGRLGIVVVGAPVRAVVVVVAVLGIVVVDAVLGIVVVDAPVPGLGATVVAAPLAGAWVVVEPSVFELPPLLHPINRPPHISTTATPPARAPAARRCPLDRVEFVVSEFLSTAETRPSALSRQVSCPGVGLGRTTSLQGTGTGSGSAATGEPTRTVPASRLLPPGSRLPVPAPVPSSSPATLAATARRARRRTVRVSPL